MRLRLRHRDGEAGTGWHMVDTTQTFPIYPPPASPLPSLPTLLRFPNASSTLYGTPTCLSVRPWGSAAVTTVASSRRRPVMSSVMSSSRETCSRLPGGTRLYVSESASRRTPMHDTKLQQCCCSRTLAFGRKSKGKFIQEGRSRLLEGLGLIITSKHNIFNPNYLSLAEKFLP
jgi:hypothetical protein